ncbi:MAG: hypothetical protein R3B72_32270 [Polyangiaceae bacterium]
MTHLLLPPHRALTPLARRALSRLALCLSLATPAAAATFLHTAPVAAQPQQLDRTPMDGVAVDAATKAQKFQASEYHKAGEEAWRKNRFSEALNMFRNAYGIVRRAETRLMIARTLDAMGDSPAAHVEAEAALAEAAPPIDEQAKTLLQAVRGKVGLVTVAVSGNLDGVAVVVNGKPLDSASWGKPVPMAPGAIQVAVTNTSGEIVEAGEVAAGGEVTIAATAPGTQAAAAPPPAPLAAPRTVAVSEDDASSWFMDHRRTIGIITATAGGVFMINFGMFGLLANGQADRLEIVCPDPNDCDPDYEKDRDKGQRYQIVANVMLGLGAATLAAGAALITWDLLDPAEPNDEARAPKLKLTAGAGSLGLEGTF